MSGKSFLVCITLLNASSEASAARVEDLYAGHFTQHRHRHEPGNAEIMGNNVTNANELTAS